MAGSGGPDAIGHGLQAASKRTWNARGPGADAATGMGGAAVTVAATGRRRILRVFPEMIGELQQLASNSP